MKVFFSLKLVLVVALGIVQGYVQAADVSPIGLLTFNSTPARLAEPAFGVSYYGLPETSQWGASVAGEFGNSRYRVATMGAYCLMDSIYRMVYGEWDFSLNREFWVVGAGYGLPIEWVPGDGAWTRHRYKVGTTLLYRRMSFSAMGWNYFSDPVQSLRYLVGFYIKSENGFDAFVQWDGRLAAIGTTLFFKHLSLSSTYRFPGFALAMSLDFYWNSWSLEGSVGKLNHSLGWFGFVLENKIQKKTIL